MRKNILKTFGGSLIAYAFSFILAGNAHAAPTPPITCNGELCQAISAALSEIQDVQSGVINGVEVAVDSNPEQGYLNVLKDVFLVDDQGNVPDLFLPQGVPPIQNPPPLAADACIIADHPYPTVTPGSLLDKALKKGKIRVLWVPQAVPFSFIDKGSRAGLSLAMWELITQKISTHYGVNVHAKFIQSPGISVNDQFAALARPDDLKCENPTPEQLAVASAKQIKKGCSDVIGGGYAITGPRKLLSDLTCTYMPLTMNAVISILGLPSGFEGLNLGAPLVPQIRALFLDSEGNPTNPNGLSLTIAAIAGSAEVPFVRFNFGTIFLDPTSPLLPGITLVQRDGTENIFGYAARQNVPAPDSGAHFVLGQIARLTYFRNPAVTDPAVCPEVGDQCKFVLMNPFAIEGTAFGTYKAE